ncbi:hypothetical protein LUZ60_002569 [Juncus effusus]|nr:hypothetical protein LUZ60_002569 [Juncus effusus]
MRKQIEEGSIEILPDHILVEIFIKLPACQWAPIASVSKRFATIFRSDFLWDSAIAHTWPRSVHMKKWPGPIPRCSGRRRYVALYISEKIIGTENEIDEIVGHIYLYLKDQLEISISPPPSSILHGTIIDQFIACGRSRDRAHELASQIWIAVINNLEENNCTFFLLKRLAQEGDIFLPYPYSRSYEVLWRVFDKLFTDFRDCFNNCSDYYDVLGFAKSRFLPLPSTWLGY